MSDDSSSRPVGTRVWSGRVLSGLLAAAFLADAVTHLMKPVPVVEAFNQLGLQLGLAVGLGLLQIVLLGLYLLPRTAVLGAILLTGYLGGAIAINLRADQGIFPIVFPVILGVGFWLGLYLRRGTLSIPAISGR